MFERLGDNTLWIYEFVNDELASIAWSSSVNIKETFGTVRGAHLQSHGQPAVEYAARVHSQSSIAKIVREVYQPPIAKDCVICLFATSDGVEVRLTDESIYRKHCLSTSRQSYEATVQALSKIAQPDANSSVFVDYLAAARTKAETPQPDASPQPPIPQPPTPSTPVPTAMPASALPSPAVAESPAPVVEGKSPLWPWLVGILALIVIAALALKRRA